MNDRQERILRAALGAVCDGDPEPMGVDADIRPVFPATGPVEGRLRVIQLVADAIAERGVFAVSDPGELSSSRERVPNDA